MAKRVKKPANDNEFIDKARRLFDTTKTAWADVYDEALDDLKFVSGYQWTEEDKTQRTREGRPALTINKLHKFVKRFCGEQRQNRPAIKTIPVGGDADTQTAHILQEIFRFVERNSNAEHVYDTGSEYQVGGSIGFWRVITEYKPDSFDQDIKIVAINNPFTVLIDPNFKNPDGSDIKYAFVTEWMPKSEFEEMYPDATPGEWVTGSQHTAFEGWYEHDRARICEYFYKEKVTKTIVATSVGEVFTLGDGVTEQSLLEEGYEIVQKRTGDDYQIKWVKMSGREILEGPTDWPGKFIPVIPVFGDTLNLEGKRKFFSLIRFAKDPQMIYNYFLTAATEAIALQPKAPFILTGDQMNGYEPFWKSANRKNLPALPYNYMPGQPKPERQSPPTVPTGAFSMTQSANADIMDTTGIYQASLGQPSNERSGKAIIARQQEADAGVFSFMDNLARAIALTGRVILDLIPTVYDTERVLHIIGEDGEVTPMPINREGLDYVSNVKTILNDVTDIGEYDVFIMEGPSYITKRREIAESMMQFIQFFPDAGPMIAPLLAKQLDWPEADKVANLMQKLLPPQLQDNPQAAMAQMQGQPPAPQAQPAGLPA